jgi:two-component system nitrate/nitrite response regulator NarL
MTAIRVLIVSPVRVLGEGLALSLVAGPGQLEIVGVSTNSKEASEALEATSADVVLIDASTPAGASIAKSLGGRVAEARLLAFALTTGDDVAVVACAEVGFVGYLPADASLEDISDAIGRVAGGEVVCSPSVAEILVRRVAALTSRVMQQEDDPQQLTAREIDVAELLQEGLSNKEIARRLRIRPATVKNHVHNILEKLRVRRRGEAMALLQRERNHS